LSSDRFSGPFGAELARANQSQQLLFLFEILLWKTPVSHSGAPLVNRASCPRTSRAFARHPELWRELPSAARRTSGDSFGFAFNLP